MDGLGQIGDAAHGCMPVIPGKPFLVIPAFAGMTDEGFRKDPIVCGGLRSDAALQSSGLVVACAAWRQAAGGTPKWRLKARWNAALEAKPTSLATRSMLQLRLAR